MCQHILYSQYKTFARLIHALEYVSVASCAWKALYCSRTSSTQCRDILIFSALQHGIPSPGRRSFLSAPQKETKKVTAQGLELPWLALRRTGSQLVCLQYTQTAPPLAPDAAPSRRPLSQGGIFDLLKEERS